MEEYYFLLGLAFLYTLVASIQDIRKTEVANWLNFSFLGVALFYRAIYSIFSGNAYFLIYGILGVVIFFFFANLLYYSQIFGGGDAKLLMAYGAILPFESFYSLALESVKFILILFLCGAVYTLIFSFGLSIGNFRKVWGGIKIEFKKYNKIVLVTAILAFLLIIFDRNFANIQGFGIFSGGFLLFISFLYVYLKAVENTCFIRLVEPEKLTEGDWLNKEVKVGGKIIRRSAHGLSFEEIRLLKKGNKKVWIKYGVPFVPSFLLALLIMVFFYLSSGFDLESFLLYLF